MARRRGNAAATQAACQSQRQLGLHLLLHGLVLSPRRVRHEPATINQPSFSRPLLPLPPPRWEGVAAAWVGVGGGLAVEAGL